MTAHHRSVACPVCKAPPGRHCTGPDGGALPWRASHPSRERAADDTTTTTNGETGGE